MNKENYNSPEFEVDKFTNEDYITTSGLEGDGDVNVTVGNGTDTNSILGG